MTALLLFCGAMMAGCGNAGKNADVSDVVEYNPFVEAFTSRRISRYAPVYLVLSEDIPESKRGARELAEAMKITPEVAGDFMMENEYTIVFRPKESFERNTQYVITADISQWFDTPKEYRRFSFPFATFPLSLRAYFTTIEVNPAGEGFDVVCVVNTPDREDDAVVESLVLFSEPVTAVWNHSPDGKRHEIRLSGLAAQEKKRDLDLVVAPNKLGVREEETLLTVNIPGRNDFTVYSVEYITYPQRFIQVTFTEELDPDQDLRGIAYLEGNISETVSIEANKLKLYPDSGRDGWVNVALGNAIRSRSGLRLGEDKLMSVRVSMLPPEVRFVSQGNIIPVTDKLTMPFQAVNLRGVAVDVVRIFENNVGHFFQMNNLDGGSGLVSVGRPVASKVIFFDGDENNLSQWSTFAIDLGDIMKPEPGAIYRVSMSFSRDLSIYPCEAEYERKSNEELIADNEAKFKLKKDSYDDGHYYYEPFDWYHYDYYERNNPCHISYEAYRKSVSANIMATNIGLTAKMGESGRMSVRAHNILTVQPEKGVAVSVYNYQNRLLGKGTTNDRGAVDIDLSDGVPHHIIASQGSQRSYLRVDWGTALSMSSFDVAGEVVQKGIKGYIYGERGVWRPGDTLHMSFMLNDRTGRLPANHPVTMELYNPLGQLYSTRTQTVNEMGLYTFDLVTEEDAPTGSWQIKVNVGGVSFQKNIRIEAIKPNRLKIDLQIGDRVLHNGKKVDIPMHVEWLQGATARNLKYEINRTFAPVKTSFAGYEGYVFDDPSKTVDREERLFAEGETDEKGDVLIKEVLEVDSSAPGMLNVNFTTRVFEESGDFSIDGRTARLSPYDVYIGVKSPQAGKKQLNTGMSHIYDVVAVDADGKPAAGVDIEIIAYKVSWHWWWSSDAGRLGRYMSGSSKKQARKLTVRTKEDGKASFNMQFPNNEWGTYFIQVGTPQGHSTGVMSYFDWPHIVDRSAPDNDDAAMLLTITTDSEEYEPGEKIKVTFPSQGGARAIVSIENGTKVIATRELNCSDEETTVEIEATADMQPNAYLYVTMLQPYGTRDNDRPIRLYGVKGVTVTSPESRLRPVLKVADEVRPEAEYSVTVSERDGRPMAYTLAIVDEGLLDLTHFPTPDPWKAFNAREALGVRTWDMYNYVLGAYGGRIEQIFSIGGDDETGPSEKASTNRFRPVVQFGGPFALKKGESRTHRFTMPNYNGRVRVMVVAGDGAAYGNTDKSVIVRKPVMLLGTLPRVIGVNEEMVVPATVFATEKGIGKVTVTIKCSGNMEVKGPDRFDLNFDDIGDKNAMFRIAVGNVPGTGRVTITAKGKGETSVYDTDIEIRSVTTPQTKVATYTVEPGQTWKGKADLFGMDGTNRLTLEVCDVKPVNLTPRLSYLIGYPHGCIEQITSKGFPQLYVSDFADLTPEQKHVSEQAVAEVINRMRSYQTSSGAFSYWPGGGTIYDWTTPYATHFLLEAEAKGFLVPPGLKSNALGDLRRTARGWHSPDDEYYRYSDDYSQAYRLYVLALSGQPETGAMNRLKESEHLSDMAGWMLAAAYAKIGRPDVARQITGRTSAVTYTYGEYDTTFGSSLRDKAVQLMVLTMLGDNNDAVLVANEISDELSSDKWLSTQATAYALMAMSQYIQKFAVGGEMNFSYSSGSKKGNIRSSQHVWSGVLLENGSKSQPVEIRNNGKSTLFARMIVDGVPEHGREEAYSNGIRMTVKYFDAGGKEIDVADLSQGVAFSSRVVVKNVSPRAYRNIVLTQVFPSGWEILNTRWLHEGDGDTNAVGVSYQDYRDDRVYSYIDYLPEGKEVTVTVDLAAIYPGIFHLPPVDCRAMYDSTVRANNEGGEVRVK